MLEMDNLASFRDVEEKYITPFFGYGYGEKYLSGVNRCGKVLEK